MSETEPPAPLPERGRPGEEGEEGAEEGTGGTGGTGGRGGRGGIGLTGDKGDTGARGLRGPSGGERGATGDTGDTGRTGAAGAAGAAGAVGAAGDTGRTGAAGATGDDRDTPFMRWAVLASVIVTAIFAIYFSVVAQNRLDSGDEQRHEFDTQITCEHAITAQTVRALKTRSLFSQQTVEAQKAWLTTILHGRDSAGSQERNLRATRDYLAALREQLQILEATPYPTLHEIVSCIQ